MDDQTARRAPHHVIEALGASVKDVAEGRMRNAESVQAEARQMLAEHERPESVTPDKANKLTRST